MPESVRDRLNCRHELIFLFVKQPSYWFAAEWGDITQITTANLAACYGDPISVGIGAVLACCLLAALAITVGAKSLDVIPMVWVRRVTAVIMLGLAAWSAWGALS